MPHRSKARYSICGYLAQHQSSDVSGSPAIINIIYRAGSACRERNLTLWHLLTPKLQRNLSVWRSAVVGCKSALMGKFYAVKKGRSPGVYTTWDDCKSQVHGFAGAQYKSFPTREAAKAWSGSKTATNSFKSATPYPANSLRSVGETSRKALSGGSQVSKRNAAVGSSQKALLDVATQFPASSKDKTVVYTDGSSLGNGKRGAKAGWGCFWGAGDSRNASGPVSVGEQTNNRGELIAIRETLKEIGREAASGELPRNGYLIMADSHYARDSLDKWAKNWANNGWKTSTGGAVKNRDIIEPAYNLLRDLRQKGISVAIDYVPAHSGHYGNEMADQLARTAAETSQ